MSPQQSIAHYRITAKLGEGGMGAVYRATDTKLNRDVAIKVLPDSFANDPDRLARFTREAQVLASLNHPNIATIHGVEERALIMELVEGITLAERIAQGPMSPDAALPLIHQLIDALEYAHEKGVVHRDLKPANLKITPEGRLKVLDFGLAKALSNEPVSGCPGSSPTLTMHATVTGVILGTADYMAPEQARGYPADKRADIWAFGAVVCEMATGKQAFGGATVSDSLAAVLTKEPDLERVPSGLRNLVRLCLAKDVKARLRDIGDARLILAHTHADATPVPATVGQRRLPWAAAILFFFIALALGAAWLLRPAEQFPAFKLAVLQPGKAMFAPSAPMMSPDGHRVLFTASMDGKTQLWVRGLNELEARPLPGTDGATDPFWAPDSRFAGFFAAGKLKKIDVAGGPAVTVCDATGTGRGATWSRNNVILFAPGPYSTLLRVPASGGSPTTVTELDASLGENSHRWPWFLPDGRHFLFVSRGSRLENVGVHVGDLESKARNLVVPGASSAMFSPPGYLVFVRERTLMVQPFDATGLRMAGDPFPVAEAVDVFLNAGAGMFGISQTGVLAYYSGGAGLGRQLTWFDRTGTQLGTVGPPGGMLSVAISPDGGKAAVERQSPQTGSFNIWLHDLVHGTDTIFTTDPAGDDFPIWSPDGGRVIFSSRRNGPWRMYQKPVDGSSPEEVFLEGEGYRSAYDWSRDGRLLAFSVTRPKSTDIWGLSNPADAGTRKPFPILQTEFQEAGAKISPNGRWLAYTSDRNSMAQVYVLGLPEKIGQGQISASGGTSPVWSRNGKELFYLAADGMLMAVDIGGGAKLEHGTPKPLFATRLTAAGSRNRFDISLDGKRFLVLQPVEQPGTQRLNIVVNWLAGVKK